MECFHALAKVVRLTQPAVTMPLELDRRRQHSILGGVQELFSGALREGRECAQFIDQRIGRGFERVVFISRDLPLLDGGNGAALLAGIGLAADVPVVFVTGRPLRWAEYRPGGLVAARWGLLEPAKPWLPESALAEAGLVLLPALAVDRRGVRLGRGRGFYDRSLPARNPQAHLVAMVRDTELVDELPCEPHDVPMTHALTPERGLITLPLGNE